MILFLKQIWWLINERHTQCGGELVQHINGKYYCKECDLPE